MIERRRKGILWDYNGDGMFNKERLSRFWQRYWNKFNRRRAKREIEKQHNYHV